MSQYQTKSSDRTDNKQLPTWPAFSIVLLLLFSVIFPPGFVTGMNIYLLILSIIVWMGKRKKFDSNLLHAIFPFFIIILIGLAAGVGAERYIYLKDVWYVANPAIIISVGFVFYQCKPDVSRGLRAFVIGGTMLSLLFLSAFVLHPELLTGGALAIRENVGTGYYASALSFTILCAYFGRWQEGLRLPRGIALTCLFISTVAMLACFSRTMLIVGIIGALAAGGVFGRRDWLKIGVILGVVLLALFVLRQSVDVKSGKIQKTYIGKLAQSFDEMSAEDFNDMTSITHNWRGYETARALLYYQSGTPLQWFIGHGFGAQVDLGVNMKLAGEIRRFIPVFHNGYIYLLVKGGAVAVVLFVYVFAWVYWIGRKIVSKVKDRVKSAPARILQAVALTLLCTTWLISGAFNKSDMFPFLLAGGFLLAAVSKNKEEFK